MLTPPPRHVPAPSNLLLPLSAPCLTLLGTGISLAKAPVSPLDPSALVLHRMPALDLPCPDFPLPITVIFCNNFIVI